MKHSILILLIVFISCQRAPELNTLIKENYQFVNAEYIELLSDIDIKYASNPEKYSSFKTDLFPLAETSHSIVEYLWDNTTISEEIIMNSTNYFSRLIEMIDDEKTKQIISEQKNDWINHLKMGNVSNEDRKVLLLTQMRTMQNFALKRILSQYQDNDYTFNKLFPIVLENKKVLNKGDIYTAEILMAGVDTTKLPILKLSEKEIPFNGDGHCVIKFETNKTGEFIWAGAVKIYNDNTGLIKYYPVKGEYKVK